ncbi:MAG: DUF6266 family protein [Pedobacter sp.]|uniref:DUF6266 family protein n=1 Tax=Pedobacter sp. TaxID=1411316 RepID=UPI003395585A
MARIKKLDPLLGDARGRVGPAVLTKVRGVPVIKIRPSINRKLRKKKNKGKPESDQTLKMGLVSPFIRKISNYTSIGFDKYKTGKAAFPSAVQYTIKYALAGKNPDFVINYPEVVISVGKREPAWSSQILCDDKKVVTVTWEIPETANLREIGNDLSYILLYDETKDKPLLYSNAKTPRSARTFSQPMYKPSFGSTIHAYIFFLAPDGKSRSRSDYVGSVTIPAQDKNPLELPQETLSTP